jgi:uncharacterized membrane protein YkvA (DUF1232 family)
MATKKIIKQEKRLRAKVGTVKKKPAKSDAVKKNIPIKSPSKSVKKTAGSKAPNITEKEIGNSAAYEKAATKAEEYAKNPKKLRSLFEAATKKGSAASCGTFAETWPYFQAMLRLIRAYYKGEYRKIPWKSLVMIITAVTYFVSPIDLIPDWILGIGFTDDALLIRLVLGVVKDDLDHFMEWETRKA